jgi:hypothetical protein
MMENSKNISLTIALITIFHAEMIKSYNFLHSVHFFYNFERNLNSNLLNL